MTIAIKTPDETLVQSFSELAALESNIVMFLRLWYENAQSRQFVSNNFFDALGHKQGFHGLKCFESLCVLCASHGRRPLIQHRVNCKCLGDDERCLARFIAYASEGNHEDALMIAATLVSPNIAPMLVGLAQDFGLALRKVALTAPGTFSQNTHPQNKYTLH